MIFKSIKVFVKKNRTIEGFFRYIFECFPVITREKLSRSLNYPYSRLELEHGFIFVHIPKCAGNAVIGSMFNQRATGHNTIEQYYKSSKKRFSSFVKIAVVRNPETRFVSAFNYLKHGGMGLYDKEFSARYLSPYSSPNEFALALYDDNLRKKILTWTHFIEQHKFICLEGNVCVDYVFKQESLDNDFRTICRVLSIDSDLVELKVLNAVTRDEKSELSKEAKAIIRNIYKKDYSILGYE